MDIKKDTRNLIFEQEPFGRVGERAANKSGNKSIVTRIEPESESEGCVCYTSQPLPVGYVWQITILEIEEQWGGGLTVGLSSALPHEVPLLLPWNQSDRHEWNYGGTSIWHGGNEILRELPDTCNLDVGQTVGFLISSSGHLHIYIDGVHVRETPFALPISMDIWGVVSVCDRIASVKSELADPSSDYLREALREGFIPHKDDLFLIHGPGGVGKSSLLAMFLDGQRYLDRTSTAVAESALNLSPVIRDMSISMFTDKWELVDIDRQARMVAHTSHHLLTGGVLEVEGLQNASTTEEDDSIDVVPVEPHPIVCSPLPLSDHLTQTNSSTNVAKNPKHPKKNKMFRFAIKLWKKVRKSFKNSPDNQIQNDVSNVEIAGESDTEDEEVSETESEETVQSEEAVMSTEATDNPPLIPALRHDPDNIEGQLESFRENLLKVMKSKYSKELVQYYSIRLVDSGGQPQFHEIVSILLPAVTGIISVFKLSEQLNVHGEVVFYKDGKPENVPYNSYLTNEQVIRHDLLTIHSEACRSGMEEMPSLAFVGTHNDLQHQCPDETPDQKDKLIQFLVTDILPEEMQSCVISNGGSLQHVMFRVNARTPGARDYEATRRLKTALMKQSRVKPRNLPIKWCWYEVAMRKLMGQIGRQILNLRECEFIGFKLGFTDSTSLTACLHYLRKYHIISFYDVVPKIVFASSQVILDKITELVTYSLKLKSGAEALTGEERKFHQQGILSPSILESKSCSKHYKVGYFTPPDLIKILKSILIITEVSEDQYLLPCVLEVSCIYPFPQPPENTIRSRFVIHFSKKSPMIGIYCCTISYLLTEAGWKLLREGGEVVQVARNSVTFELPNDLPGTLIFIDPISSFLEVVVEYSELISHTDRASLYEDITDSFKQGMRKAMKTLNYEVRTPQLTFLCPKQGSQCSIYPHVAKVSTKSGLLVCSVKRRIATPLSQDQKMWLEGKSEQQQVKKAECAPPITITNQKPNLPDLLQLKVPQKVAGKYHKFGVLLLNDEDGNQMEVIKHKYEPNAKAITQEILRKWLTEGRVETTWETLVSILRKCDLSYLAQQIELACQAII